MYVDDLQGLEQGEEQADDSFPPLEAGEGGWRDFFHWTN